jgi:hypothetical protein
MVWYKLHALFERYSDFLAGGAYLSLEIPSDPLDASTLLVTSDLAVVIIFTPIVVLGLLLLAIQIGVSVFIYATSADELVLNVFPSRLISDAVTHVCAMLRLRCFLEP